MQISSSPTPYDVVIVGSGASGGWAAKRFTEAGLRVAVLEAGRQLKDADYREHVPASALPYRGLTKRPLAVRRPVQSGSYACANGRLTGSWTICASRTSINQIRSSCGCVLVWSAAARTSGAVRSLRFSEYDLNAASYDGHGSNWPITYEELVPYYEIVEDYVGIQGMPEGLRELPDSKFQPAMPMNCAETALRTRIKAELGRTMTQARTANLTRPDRGRAACHFCGPCEHGCVTHSYFNASFTTMADAMATGRCTLITGAMAYQVLIDPDTRRARGILYVDRTTHEPREVFGRIVALCAQTQESTRILFNSRSRQDPNGLANSSGLLGKGLMTHFSDAGATGEMPEFSEKPSFGPRRPCFPLIVNFRNVPGGPKMPDFLRGYAYGTYLSNGPKLDAPGFGQAYKKAVAEAHPTQVNIGGWGECLRYEDNYVDVDPNTVDEWGIPVARIHLTPRENERTMLKDMATAGAEMLEAGGCRNVQEVHGIRGQAHEVGAARMGTDPKTSVLTPHQNTHDIRNLFVLDGSGFPSVSWQNPTLTIMSLAVRAGDYIMDQLKRKDL